MSLRVAIVSVRNRNRSISIGALVIKDELERNGIAVGICDYQTAFAYSHVLVSMTATDDIYDIYRQCIRYGWGKRTFTAFVGGFGCQNPIALAPFIDYAFFGRLDGIASDYIANPEAYPQHSFVIANPHKVSLRQVDKLYPFSVTYGANNTRWTEKFIGCPYRCKFCHYSHNRKYVGCGTYINNGLSTGSPELMLKDIASLTHKVGRLTAGLDGYSERLRFAFGKRITWDMVEEAMDTLASFKGSTYLKLYNINNFPTETEADEQEFNEFWREYVSISQKADGVVKVDVFNTAFRPSLNTPMERMPVRLHPEARKEVPEIALGKGFAIGYTHLTKGWKEHLKDVVSIRYTNVEHIQRIATFDDLQFDWNDYLREYTSDEPLHFKWIQ
jgi:hypothetical protein